MKKRTTVLSAVLLSVALIFGSCSSPKTSSSSAAPEQPASSASGASQSAAPEKTLSGEIVVATWAGDPFESAWKEKAAEFEKKTGVKVVIDAVPWENLREKSVLELASGSGAYDVVYVHPSWFEEFANNGYLMPVTDYASQAELDLFLPNLLKDYTRNDTLYGLPDFITTQVLAYRTDIFEQEGLAPPQNWDELLATCEKLTGKTEYAPITFPGKKGGTLASVFSAFLVSNGGWYLDDGGKPTLDTPEALEAAEYLGKLAKYQPSGFLNVHWDENSKIAGSGKAAMAVIMTPNSAWLEDAATSATAGKWAYAPIKSNKGTPGGLVDDYCWSVVQGTKNKDAAGEFVKFIAGTECQTYFTEKSSTCGATKAYYEDVALQASKPVLAAMQEVLSNTRPAPSWATWAAEQEALEVNLQKVMTGEMTAADAMKGAQDKLLESRK